MQRNTAVILGGMGLGGVLTYVLNRHPLGLNLVVGATGGGLVAYGILHRSEVSGKASSFLGFRLLARRMPNAKAQKVLEVAKRAA